VMVVVGRQVMNVELTDAEWKCPETSVLHLQQQQQLLLVLVQMMWMSVTVTVNGQVGMAGAVVTVIACGGRAPN